MNGWWHIKEHFMNVTDIIYQNQRGVILCSENNYTMGANSPFQQLFNTFLQSVQDAGKSLEVASQFGPNRSTESMFEYLWGLEEAHQCIDFNIIESLKSEIESGLLRIEGNIYYHRGELDQALHLYNMCINLAPPPLLNNNINEMPIQGYENDINEQQHNMSLAYGFANRSAVLFELEEYEKSINDIDYAMEYGYLIGQSFNLVERKVKCLLELNKQQDAKSLLNSTIHLLPNLKMDEAKKITARDKLLFVLNDLQQDHTSSEHYEENIPKAIDPIENLTKMKINNIDSSDSQVNNIPDYNIPKLDFKHSTIPSVSSALKLTYTAEQGRFFVAERDIKPGELILVEKSPHSCLHLKKDVLFSHCCVCLMKCNNPLPCKKCTMVMFCSTACQSESLNGHTDVECKTLKTLESLCVGKYCSLAFKVISQIPYMKLKKIVPASNIQLDESCPNLHGFNRNGIFDSSDFLSMYAMINNQSKRNGDDLLKRVAIAFILTKLLIKCNCYFIDEAGLPFHPSNEDITLLGSIFITLIMSLHCNAHPIGELQTMDNGAQSITVVGTGVFPAQSLLNHSCNPDTFRSTIGSHMTSYAIRFIPKESEVTDSYGYHYVVHDTEYRQVELKKNFCFDCKCEACMGEWRIPEGESSKPKFKSLSNTNFSEQIEKEEDYMEKYNKLRVSFNKAYFNLIKEGITEGSKKAFIDFIEFLDMYVFLPCKMYHDVQGLLKFCIDIESSTKHPCK